MDPVGSAYFIPTKFGSLGGDQLVDIFHMEISSTRKMDLWQKEWTSVFGNQHCFLGVRHVKFPGGPCSYYLQDHSTW